MSNYLFYLFIYNFLRHAIQWFSIFSFRCLAYVLKNCEKSGEVIVESREQIIHGLTSNIRKRQVAFIRTGTKVNQFGNFNNLFGWNFVDEIEMTEKLTVLFFCHSRKMLRSVRSKMWRKKTFACFSSCTIGWWILPRESINVTQQIRSFM